MKRKFLLALALIVQTFACLAQTETAQAGTDNTGNTQSLVWGTVLPMAILAVFLFVCFRYAQRSPRARRHDRYMDRHEQHMTQVELSLERIAKALEKKE